MKAFFCAMRGDYEQKSLLIKQSNDLDNKNETSDYHDLLVIQEFFKKMQIQFCKQGYEGLPLYDKDKQKHIFLKINVKDSDQLLQVFENYKQKSFQKISLKSFNILDQSSNQFSAWNLFKKIIKEILLRIEETLGEENLQEDDEINKLVNFKFDSNEVSAQLFQQINSKNIDFYERISLEDTQKEIQKETNQQVINKTGTLTKQLPLTGSYLNIEMETKNTITSNQSAPLAIVKRGGLRKKMDFTQQQLSQINLDQLLEFKDFIIDEYQQSLARRFPATIPKHIQPILNTKNKIQSQEQEELAQQFIQNSPLFESNESRQALDFVFSHKELYLCKQLMEQKRLFEEMKEGKQNNQSTGQKQIDQKENFIREFNIQDFNNLLKLLNSFNKAIVPAAIRQLFNFTFSNIGHKFIDQENSVILYKLFQYLMIAEGPFSASQWPLHSVQQSEIKSGVSIGSKHPWHNFTIQRPQGGVSGSVCSGRQLGKLVESFQWKGSQNYDLLNLIGDRTGKILIQLFETSLLNKNIPKELKSTRLLEQRQLLYEYLVQNKEEFGVINQENEAFEYQVRLMYVLMVGAFEVRNDMQYAVTLYSQLIALFNSYSSQFEKELCIYMPHIEPGFYIDRAKIAEFAEIKIKHAKVFKDYDQGLQKLKKLELSINEKQQFSKQGKNKLAPNESSEMTQEEFQKKYSSEFDRHGNFYLDQFFVYLNQATQINLNNPYENEIDEIKFREKAGSQTQNEEKAKEMWQQLIYCLQRGSAPFLLKVIQKILTIFQAVSHLNKNFYQQFLLKKFDFLKIFTALHKHLNSAFKDIQISFQYPYLTSVGQLKENALKVLSALFGLNPETLDESILQVEAQLIRMQLSILRHYTPEFLHYNIFLTQSSNTIFQNYMNNKINNPNNQNVGSNSNQSTNGQSNSQNNTQIIFSFGTNSGQILSLIDLFPQILLFLETFKAILSAEQEKDNSQNLRGVFRLLAHFDRLASSNEDKQDLFLRSYANLVLIIFPFLFKALRTDIHRITNNFQQKQFKEKIEFNVLKDYQNLKENQSEIELTQKTPLIIFVSQFFKFFFDMKILLQQGQILLPGGFAAKDAFDIKDRNDDQDMEKADSDIEDKQDEDEDEMFFRKWNHLNCLFMQLKREKQVKNFNNPTNTPQLEQLRSPMLSFLLNNIKLDANNISDLISVLSFLMKDRPLRIGELTFKDVKMCQNFNEMVLEFANVNFFDLKTNEYVIQIKKNIGIEKFCLENQKENDNIQKLKDLSSVQILNIQKIVHYLTNFLLHTSLSQFQFQIPKFDLAVKIDGVPATIANLSQHTLQFYITKEQFHSTQPVSSLQSTFYYTQTKKGSPLVTQQIAKIQETISQQLKPQEDTQKKQKIQQDQSLLTLIPYSQYFNFSQNILKGFNRLVTIELALSPLLTEVQENSISEKSVKKIKFVQLMREYYFAQSQALVYQQKYLINYTSALFQENPNILFISEQDKKNKFKTVTLEEQMKMKRKRYKINAQASTLHAIKMLNQAYLLFQESRKNSESEDFFPEINNIHLLTTPYSQKNDINLFQLALNCFENLLQICISRIKVIKMKYSAKDKFDLLNNMTNLNIDPTQDSTFQHFQSIQQQIFSIDSFSFKLKDDQNKQQNRTQRILEIQQRQKLMQKIKNLKKSALALAQICECIELCQVVWQDERAQEHDPRRQFQQNQKPIDKIRKMEESVNELIQTFLNLLKNSQQNIENKMNKFDYQHLIILFDTEAIYKKTDEIYTRNGMESMHKTQRLSISFIPPIIKAKFIDIKYQNLQNKDNDIKEMISKEIQIQNSRFSLLRRAIEIAQANSDTAGLLESLKKFLKYSFRLSIEIKYSRLGQELIVNQNFIGFKFLSDQFQKSSPQSLNQQDKNLLIQGYEQILSEIVKPIVQDSQLKAYIIKEVSLGGNQGDELQLKNEIPSDKQGNRAGTKATQQKQEVKILIDEQAVLAQETNAMKHRQGVIKKEKKQKKKEEESSEEDLMECGTQDENNLIQIYKLIDFLVNNLASQNAKYLMMTKLQMISCKALLTELELSKSKEPKKYAILVKMMDCQRIANFWNDDYWNGLVFEGKEYKNLLTSNANQEITGFASFKFKLNGFFIHLCRMALDYEPLRELHKKKFIIYKQIDSAIQLLACGIVDKPNTNKFVGSIGLRYVLRASFAAYIDTLAMFAYNKQQELHRIKIEADKAEAQGLRKTLIQDEWIKLKKEFSVTRESIPGCLKEAFELLIEINSKKNARSSSSGKGLLNMGVGDRIQVGRAILFVTSMSSSDQNLENKINSLGMLGSIRGIEDGVKICVNWYIENLEKQGGKKHMETLKKLKALSDDLKKPVAFIFN